MRSIPKQAEHLGWKVTGLVFLVLLIAGAAVVANGWKSKLRVEKIRVDGNRILLEDEILILARLKTNERLFDTDLFAAESRVRSNHFVANASVTRHVPNQIVIAVQERVPAAMVLADRMYLLDASGYVMPQPRARALFDLPVISGIWSKDDLIPGRKTQSPSIREALAILATAGEVGNEFSRLISEVHIGGNRDIILYTAESGVPVILGRGNVGIKLVKLEGFWESVILRKGIQDLQYIDLRFNDQVVVRWNSQTKAKAS